MVSAKPIGTGLANSAAMRWQTGAVDPDGLLAACRSGSATNFELLHEILGHFVRQNRDRLTKATGALEAVDRVQLAQLAHAIKGSAAMIGAGYLSHLAHRVELEAADASPPALVNGVAAMQHEFAAVLVTLRVKYPAAFETEPSV